MAQYNDRFTDIIHAISKNSLQTFSDYTDIQALLVTLVTTDSGNLNHKLLNQYYTALIKFSVSSSDLTQLSMPTLGVAKISDSFAKCRHQDHSGISEGYK